MVGNLWATTIESDLPKVREHIESAWKNRGSTQTYMNLMRGGGVISTTGGNVTNINKTAKVTPGISGNA